jgi:tRNA threonylcarbamoyladenosine biosynthesis protein TsaB
MTILGLETATAVCGAAVVRDGECLAERSIEAAQVHSEKLVVLIEEALCACALKTADLDGIAISIGPGSYTGLRIGLSVAKGLAYALGRSLLAVPTLDALAWNGLRQNDLSDRSCILACIESRREELFCASYRVHGGGIAELHSPAPRPVASIVDLVQGEQRVCVIGSGADVLQNHLRIRQDTAIAERLQFPPRDRRQCSAAAIAIFGEQLLRRNETADLVALEPQYLKEFYTTARPHHIPVQ